MIEKILDLLFPRFCVGCHTPNTQLCTACTSRLSLAHTSPSPHIYTAFSYRDPLVRTVIWHVKYRGKYPLATPIAQTMADVLQEEISEHVQLDTNGSLIVIPVPLSKKRFRERGYNQATQIAEKLVKQYPSFCTLETRALQRTRNTQPQMKIKDKTKRRNNVKDCFIVRAPSRIRGTDALLIDDVTTTGATLLEARKALKKAGARSVLCVAVAH